MPSVVLGLDIGGANLKAATPDKRAVSVPFALWRQPDRLPAALAALVEQFPDADELAVTMTGELCDCFETKRDGVNAILNAVMGASRGRRIRVWTTDGAFTDVETARRQYLKVAAANWHALATLAGQYLPSGRVILIDVGSTTTDVIPILDGVPVPEGKTDYERLASLELLYAGVRRTPICTFLGLSGAAELFATTLDAYLLLGLVPENPDDTDTADGRPATRSCAHARLSRMLGGDAATIPPDRTETLAQNVYGDQRRGMYRCLEAVCDRLDDMPSFDDDPRARADPDALPDAKPSRIRGFVLSGSGEFLARAVTASRRDREDVSLTDRLGPQVAACAPAYAVAVLAFEGPQPPGGRLTKGLWPWSGS